MNTNIEILFLFLFLNISIIYSTEVTNSTNTTMKSEVLNATLNVNDSGLITAQKVEVNVLKLNETRRRSKGKHSESRSTSSESNDPSDDEREKGDGSSVTDDDGGFLGTSSCISSDKSSSSEKDIPKSSAERRGWRKWHRKCTPCPEDEAKKWKHPGINWICGAYQHARRSFKSSCSMHLRNCQDGTMFVKIHDHRCADDDPKAHPRMKHGMHFFYDYKVSLFSSDDSSSSASTEETHEKGFDNKGDYEDYLDNIILKYLAATTLGQ